MSVLSYGTFFIQVYNADDILNFWYNLWRQTSSLAECAQIVIFWFWRVLA